MEITYITDSDIVAFNRTHDSEHPEFLHAGRMSSPRFLEGNKVGGVLTDRKIAKYEREGYYSAAYKEARKELMANKTKRRGNFDQKADGSLVYRP